MDKAQKQKPSGASPKLSMEDFDITAYAPIIFAVFIVVVTIVAYIVRQKFGLKRRHVLLTGLSDSGKTLLWSQLIHKEHRQTHTSVVANDDVLSTSSGATLNVVDIPGHERVRNKFFDAYKSSARAVVFVIDSVNIQKDIRDVAEFLYTVLSDSTITKNCPNVLIVCNKQDQTMAKGSSVIKSLLEKEMNLVRLTKSSQLESVDPSVSSNVFLGKQGKDFDFTQMPQPVDFVESSAVGTESTKPHIDELTLWISKIA